MTATDERAPVHKVVRGLDWWFCPVCGWDRDDEAAVAEHVAFWHPEEQPQPIEELTAPVHEAARRSEAAAKAAETRAKRRAKATTTEDANDGEADADQDDAPVAEPPRRGGGDVDGGGRDE